MSDFTHLPRPASLRSLLLCAALALTGCASLPPQAFDLTGDSEIAQGWLHPTERRLEARLGGQLFTGYYIVASSTVQQLGPTPLFRRWGFPGEGLTVVTANTARATLAAADGERLSCELLFDGPRLLGECRARNGKVYQLTTRVP